MLSHEYEPKKHTIYAWFVSKKLDGQRCFWDGGITRGMAIADVPFANTTKDDRLLNKFYRATGLWTRNAKVVRAPDSWLDRLPKMPLDGELYAGLNGFQLTSSIVRDLQPSQEWNRVKFVVFDSPAYIQVFSDSTINTIFYKKVFKGVGEWAMQRANDLGINTFAPMNFETVYAKLNNSGIQNETVRVLEQVRLPFGPEAISAIEKELADYVTLGGEGLMLRKPASYWTPERSWNLLKVKKCKDSEATVVGYAWGRATDKGSRLLGMMGALVVLWQGKTFELSGFTDAERQMSMKETGNSAGDIGRLFPGQRVDTGNGIHNNNFPVGSRVTFTYRELTDQGIPKEARYYRKA